MASKQDILTAIKNLDIFLKIPELKGAEVRLNRNGSPFVYTGGFNMVFQLTKKKKKWALRVWHVPMGETKERYLAISKYLSEQKLSYFADFIFDEKSILINGELQDTIRMEWLDGVLLKEYIENNLNNKDKLEKLASDFSLMCKELREHKISHGDLQEGNILIDEKGALKLIDYDSICVPEIEGEKELVTGLKGYQHPSRFSGGKASLKADNFSELIIYLSILAFSENPTLWEKYDVKNTQYLLFTETDFEDLENSEIYRDLSKLSSKIAFLLSILQEYLRVEKYTDLKPYPDYLLPPKIISFKSEKDTVIKGGETFIEWEVENAIEVKINNKIGKVESKGKIEIKPDTTDDYVLTAIGFSETIEEHLSINIFPTPVIKTIQVPTPQFENISNLNINFPSAPDFSVEIGEFNNINVEFSIKIDSPVYDSDTWIFNNLKNKPINKTNNLLALFNKVKNKNRKAFNKILKNQE